VLSNSMMETYSEAHLTLILVYFIMMLTSPYFIGNVVLMYSLKGYCINALDHPLACQEATMLSPSFSCKDEKGLKMF